MVPISWVSFNNLKVSFTFAGMSGPVMIDKRGNRVPAFVFENIQSSSNLPFLELDVSGTKVKQYTAKVVWPGGSTRIPDDEPKCLFDPCKGNKIIYT